MIEFINYFRLYWKCQASFCYWLIDINFDFNFCLQTESIKEYLFKKRFFIKSDEDWWTKLVTHWPLIYWSTLSFNSLNFSKLAFYLHFICFKFKINKVLTDRRFLLFVCFFAFDQFVKVIIQRLLDSNQVTFWVIN